MELDPSLRGAFAHDPAAWDAVRARAPGPRVATDTARSGAALVRVDGRGLHSARDPVAEARDFAANLSLSEAEVVVLLGFGSGHVARALAQHAKGRVVAFEPDLDVLAQGLPHGAIPENLSVVTSPARLGRFLYGALGPRTRGLLVAWPPSQRIAPMAHAEATRITSEAIDRASLRARTASLRARGWLDHFLTNVPRLSQDHGLHQLRGRLTGVPAFVVAAGPSLDRNIQRLAAVRGRGLILAVNTATGALAKAGIRPDAIVCVESLDVSAQLRALPWISEVPAFLELTAHPNTWDLPFERRIGIAVDTGSCSAFAARLDPGLFLPAGFCVANAATAIAHALGCDPIVLVGSDLAYSGDRVYASGTIFEELRATVGEDGSAALSGLDAKRAIEAASGDAMCGNRMPERARTHRVPAWGGSGDVVTTRDFALFRDWYAWSAENLRGTSRHLINATEGGASIPGWEELSLHEVLERHLPDGAGRPAAEPRLREALDRPALPPGRIDATLRGELERIRHVLRLGLEACGLVGHRPDGDLHASPRQARRLDGIHRTVQQLLHDSPLAGEALVVPLDRLHASNQITTLSLYETMGPPLQELEARLARMLQRSVSEPPRARRAG